MGIDIKRGGFKIFFCGVFCVYNSKAAIYKNDLCMVRVVLDVIVDVSCWFFSRWKKESACCELSSSFRCVLVWY